jgi:beta-1,4-N-acetylglucosaminyltransferase
MIFVTIGTSEPFDRLFAAVEALGTSEDVVAQVGTSTRRPVGAQCFDFLSFDDTLEYMRAARAVVCHAGVGSVLSSLTVGRVPVVMPRLRRYGEAVDDHQLPFARRLAAEGLVVNVENERQLGDALVEVQSIPPGSLASSALAMDLKAYIASILPAAAPRAPRSL